MPQQGIRRHRRVGQHQHRPAVQAAALGVAGAALDGRHRPRQSRVWRAPASWDWRPVAEGVDWLLEPRREARPGVRGHQRLRAPRRRAAIRRGRHPRHRPDPGRRRPGRDPAGEPARASRRAERQHDHLRRAGHHPDRVRRVPRRRRCPTPRSSRRWPRCRRARARAPTSTSSPRPPARAWRPSAAPSAARRSSS